jgi:hypothetical protein
VQEGRGPVEGCRAELEQEQQLAAQHPQEKVGYTMTRQEVQTGWDSLGCMSICDCTCVCASLPRVHSAAGHLCNKPVGCVRLTGRSFAARRGPANRRARTCTPGAH